MQIWCKYIIINCLYKYSHYSEKMKCSLSFPEDSIYIHFLLFSPKAIVNRDIKQQCYYLYLVKEKFLSKIKVYPQRYLSHELLLAHPNSFPLHLDSLEPQLLLLLLLCSQCTGHVQQAWLRSLGRTALLWDGCAACYLVLVIHNCGKEKKSRLIRYKCTLREQRAQDARCSSTVNKALFEILYF